MAMKDTRMAACEWAVVELIAACRTVQTLASIDSAFTPAFARDTAMVCDACRKECQPFVNKYIECSVVRRVHEMRGGVPKSGLIRTPNFLDAKPSRKPPRHA
jgi:hypothetical protein